MLFDLSHHVTEADIEGDGSMGTSGRGVRNEGGVGTRGHGHGYVGTQEDEGDRLKKKRKTKKQSRGTRWIINDHSHGNGKLDYPAALLKRSRLTDATGACGGGKMRYLHPRSV
jgi:hypothetical protein